MNQTDNETTGAREGRVLLAMSTARKSPLSMERAAQIAKERGTTLLAIFALEEDILEDVVDKLSSEGWIGERPSQTFYDSAVGQRQAAADRKLTRATEIAERVGVEIETRVVPGSYEEAVHETVASEDPSTVVLTRRRRSEVSRFFFGSPATRLANELPVPVVLVEED